MLIKNFFTGAIRRADFTWWKFNFCFYNWKSTSCWQSCEYIAIAHHIITLSPFIALTICDSVEFYYYAVCQGQEYLELGWKIQKLIVFQVEDIRLTLDTGSIPSTEKELIVEIVAKTTSEELTPDNNNVTLQARIILRAEMTLVG